MHSSGFAGRSPGRRRNDKFTSVQEPVVFFYFGSNRQKLRVKFDT